MKRKTKKTTGKKKNMGYLSLIMIIGGLALLGYGTVISPLGYDCACYDSITKTFVPEWTWIVINGKSRECERGCEWGDWSSLYNRYQCTQNKINGEAYLPYHWYDGTTLKHWDRDTNEIVVENLGGTNINTRVNFYSFGDVICDSKTDRKFECGPNELFYNGQRTFWNDLGISCMDTTTTTTSTTLKPLVCEDFGYFSVILPGFSYDCSPVYVFEIPKTCYDCEGIIPTTTMTTLPYPTTTTTIPQNGDGGQPINPLQIIGGLIAGIGVLSRFT